MKTLSLRDELTAIVASVYSIGLNDGEKNIGYFPKPVNFNVDKILSLFDSTVKSIIGKPVKKIKVGKNFGMKYFI